MPSFEDLQKVNATIRTTNIKGKDYAEVNQRIKAFRMLYPMGFIRTELLNLEGGECLFQAEVGFYTADGDEMLLGVGHAHEKEGSSSINRTSYVENCETSAVGRALGMAGFGIDTSVASAEEVSHAISQQEQRRDLSGFTALKKRLMDLGQDEKSAVQTLMQKYGKPTEMGDAEYAEALAAADEWITGMERGLGK